MLSLQQAVQDYRDRRSGDVPQAIDRVYHPSLVEAQRTNAVADMLRSEAQEKLIGLLQEMVSRPAGALDMEPLRDMMVAMQTMNVDRPRVGYEFAIARDGQGFMRSITATPISPTIN